MFGFNLGHWAETTLPINIFLAAVSLVTIGISAFVFYTSIERVVRWKRSGRDGLYKMVLEREVAMDFTMLGTQVLFFLYALLNIVLFVPSIFPSEYADRLAERHAFQGVLLLLIQIGLIVFVFVNYTLRSRILRRVGEMPNSTLQRILAEEAEEEKKEYGLKRNAQFTEPTANSGD